MKVVVRIRFSHARRLVPGVNCVNAAYALTDVSWTRSSASVGFLVIRSAAEYNWPSCGMTSRSNRARSSLECSAWLMFAPVVVISFYIDAREARKRTPCCGNHCAGRRDGTAGGERPGGGG